MRFLAGPKLLVIDELAMLDRLPHRATVVGIKLRKAVNAHVS